MDGRLRVGSLYLHVAVALGPVAVGISCVDPEASPDRSRHMLRMYLSTSQSAHVVLPGRTEPNLPHRGQMYWAAKTSDAGGVDVSMLWLALVSSMTRM